MSSKLLQLSLEMKAKYYCSKLLSILEKKMAFWSESLEII